MATDVTSSSFTCHICGEEGTSTGIAECNWCDQRFHLNQRNDNEGRDCGEVWIDEQYLALQFACNACLAGVARRPQNAATEGERRRRYRKRQ